jgi:aryl-alcohol dehydrogenase-like predicted oxidoreductase
VLQNDNVSSAIIGASRPEQVQENVKAVEVRIPQELMTRIDEVLGDAVERDAARTARSAPQHRPT